MATVPMARPSDGAEVPIHEGDVPSKLAQGFRLVRQEDAERFAATSPEQTTAMLRPGDGKEVPIHTSEVGKHLGLGYRLKPLEARAAPSPPQPVERPSEEVTIEAPEEPELAGLDTQVETTRERRERRSRETRREEQ